MSIKVKTNMKDETKKKGKTRKKTHTKRCVLPAAVLDASKSVRRMHAHPWMEPYAADCIQCILFWKKNQINPLGRAKQGYLSIALSSKISQQLFKESQRERERMRDRAKEIRKPNVSIRYDP